MNLTIAFITARKEPKIEWFFDSLVKQVTDDIPNILVVDHLFQDRLSNLFIPTFLKHHLHLLVPNIKNVIPKPTIWQGKHRITKEDWWAKSNALNTAICLCKTDFITFVDDRSVLMPGWLNSVKEAMAGNYAVCGTYEKWANMKVEDGVVIYPGELLGTDARPQFGHPVPTRDWYGGTFALPLEWCLAVNGFSEDLCDGLGSEDSMFGVTLRNNRFPMKYDSRMKIIEDRTPGQIDGALKRADKNTHLGQQAKSWAIVRALNDKTSSQNSFDIRHMRQSVLAGNPFPPPTGAHFDWYDSQPISEMT